MVVPIQFTWDFLLLILILCLFYVCLMTHHHLLTMFVILMIMMMSCQENTSHITGPLWGESTGHSWIPPGRGNHLFLLAWTISWANSCVTGGLSTLISSRLLNWYLGNNMIEPTLRNIGKLITLIGNNLFIENKAKQAQQYYVHIYMS